MYNVYYGPGSADALVPLGTFTHTGCPEAYGQASPASVGVAALAGRSGRISGTPSKAVAGAVKETSQGTFAKGVDTKWPETRRASNGLYDTLVAPSPTRQETVSVPPRG